MASVAETIALYQKVVTVFNIAEPLQAQTVSALQSFNNGGYKQANAQSTYDSILKTRADYKAEYDSVVSSTQQAAGAAFETLSDSQKIEVNRSQVLMNVRNRYRIK